MDGAEDVAQPPPAVRRGDPPAAPYVRNLPHLQNRHDSLFVTFNTSRRWTLPDAARDLVLAHCIHDHGSLFRLHAAVVMPDHVHLVLTPLVDETGAPIPLSKIMNGIKGASAHSVNRVLRRTGHVWQDESFDHVLRSYESARAKAEYVCENPVRAQLVEHEDDYRWLWREWVEGVTDRAHFGP